MYELNQTIEETLERWKAAGIVECTLASRRQYCRKLLEKANAMGKEYLDQELVVAFLHDNKGSKEIASMHFRIAKHVDDVCKTRLLDLKGHYLNPLSFPTKEESLEYFKDVMFPISENISLPYLIIKTMDELSKLMLSKSTLGQYMKAFKDVNEEADKKGIQTFSKSFCNNYLQQNESNYINKKINEWVRKIRRRSVLCLLKVSEHGTFTWQQFKKLDVPLPKDIQKIEDSYLDELSGRNLQSRTIGLYRYVIHSMLLQLDGKRENLWDMKPKEVQKILNYFKTRCNTTSMSTVVPIIKAVLVFLHYSKHTNEDLSRIVMTPLHSKRQAKGYILSEDNEKLTAKIASLNKRDKAILLMAMETGLRESDILGMRLGQVDWRKDTLTIVQQKTGHLLILPLLPDIGNSLASYILDERPIPAAGCEDYIFLRRQAPFHNLRTVYPLTRKLLESLHIQAVNTNKLGGLHLLRHSLVYRLLKEEIPDYTITKVLGHASKESDKPYLSLDERMLKECAMQIPSLALENGGFLQ